MKKTNESFDTYISNDNHILFTCNWTYLIIICIIDLQAIAVNQSIKIVVHLSIKKSSFYIFIFVCTLTLEKSTLYSIHYFFGLWFMSILFVRLGSALNSFLVYLHYNLQDYIFMAIFQ